MNDNEEARLVRESLQGRTDSFAELLNRYEKPVFNAALRILNDYEDARDVTQNAFLKAFESLRQFDSRYRFFSWIYRIAVNESLNLRKSRRRVEAIGEETAKDESTPESVFDGTELSREVQAALMEIDEDYRVVLVLRHFHDCSYRDIADILEIPEKTVKSRLFTARGLLREVLGRRGVYCDSAR